VQQTKHVDVLTWEVKRSNLSNKLQMPNSRSYYVVKS